MTHRSTQETAASGINAFTERPGVMDGWQVTRADTGRWRAVRRTSLDERQIAYGCADLLTTDSYGELELAATAEAIKVSIIDAAWRLHRRMAEADRMLEEM